MTAKLALAEAPTGVLPRDFQINLIRALAKAQAQKDHLRQQQG